MIAQFFVDRPVFAWVISIVIILGGLVSMVTLSIESSPQITPPTVVISAFYPGADAETVMECVATPIEQQLSGAPNLLYYQSKSANDGSLSITLSFEIGTDLDIAAVEVQNRLKRAEPSLPQEVIRQGTSVSKRMNTFLGIIALQSTNPDHDALFLSNYAMIYMLDTLKRVPGVGQVMVFGNKDYSMRISVNPDLLVAKGLTVTDVAQAIREQNGLYAAGEIGGRPNTEDVEFTFPVLAPGRLTTPQEFEDIILVAREDGAVVRLKDVASVQLGAQGYSSEGRFRGETTAILPVIMQPLENALETMEGVKAALAELSKSFPEGMHYTIPMDTTRFIKVSLWEVAMTFFQSTGLVVLVVLMFLGSWRASIVPLVAIPISIVGTFMGLLVLGFTINTLTLFALVLAIGIVVDNAIVAVENVERIMEDEHLAPRAATIKAMKQVTGPIIASVLVLAAVYVPVAFLGGSTGVMYRQFGITIAMAVAVSGVVALTLTPALCAALLKPNHNKLFIFRWFDKSFDFVSSGFMVSVKWVIRLGVISVLLFGALIWGAYTLMSRVPTAFVPQEDQGYFFAVVQLPPGASLNRTIEVVKQVEEFLLAQPEVEGLTAMCGQDNLSGANTTNVASMFVVLRHWDERPNPENSAQSVVGRVFGRFGAMKEATVLAFIPPPVSGLGLRAGIEAQLEARGSSDINELAEVMHGFVARLNADPLFEAVSGVLTVEQPKIRVNLNQTRAKVLGIPIGEIYNTLQAYLGSYYINDFNVFGRVYRVQLQADSAFRDAPDDIRKIHVRNRSGDMIELAGVLDVAMDAGPNVVSRFNSFSSVQITGAPAPGVSTGQLIRRVQELAAEHLPPGYAVEWSSGSYQEIKAGNQSVYVIIFGMIMVFLVLAAQYEKWSLPVTVLLTVPFAAFGAALWVWYKNGEMDIYFQIGLLTVVGLTAKMAILVIEFCAVERAEGRGIVEAALEAARLRLRPVMMTAVTTILGALPLVLSTGAGAAGRRSIGGSVMGGMISACFLAIFFIPLFFVIVQWLSELFKKPKPVTAGDAPADKGATS
ncbi:MAG TPA: efflux RND transporter permease subunit [Candidatus Hydrogenedentes bacterium]|jgi:hydrophobe/amphiphile efflux-1 (HAE1) family protein|nr:MAG: Efflux pump membrane transporter BepE [Candidatus Hydrogenedentes bacterium ADurb.Bin170]HOD96552.1 efflux RND transporter permease subunit [Candidatus Hydrogenedentota bacterium]HOR51963.1 efflux RND transporter permease subunit [Candidatus Hydrogenedentota bacterium]HPK26004.1 efflux RND transporter permease subunit [Candidatus Hydrogenedentota bacterium]HPX87540.1 efflux RND transporter permease subunit [Candidatus Hydrogenedentota bacterium]